MFSRAIPSPLCQGGHCHPPGIPVIHSQAQRAVCPAPGPLTPDPAQQGITTRAPRAIVCLQHGEDLSPCEVSQEKSETHRASCPRVSREHQAEPKGCKVLLIPLAPPIAPETGTQTQTLSQTHTHKHTNKRYTQTQHIHYLHTYTYKSTNTAHKHKHKTQRPLTHIYSQQPIDRNTTHTIHAYAHKHTNTHINIHTNITHMENTHILIYTQIDTLNTQIHTNITHTHIHTNTLCTAPPQHTLKHNTHTQTHTHRHSHHGLGLTALLSVQQEECPCLASPGAVCSPELSVSPLRANTLQAEWRRSVTVPQTYTHTEDMAGIFSVYVIRTLSSRAAFESAAFSPEKREEEVGGAPQQGHPDRKLCRLHLSAALVAPLSSILTWKTPWTEEPGRLQSMGSQRVGHD